MEKEQTENNIEFLELLVLALSRKVETLTAELRLSQKASKISYNLAEASKLVGLSPGALRNRCRSGLLPFSQDTPGGTILIKYEDLHAYVSESNSSSLDELRSVSQKLKKDLRRGLWP